MTYIIGVDGGGTKTIGLLTDQDGHILARAESGPSNYHAVGEAQTKKVLADVISQLLTEVNETLEGCTASNPGIQCAFCLGLAGVAAPIDQKVIERICDEIGVPENRIVTHDARIGLVGGADKLAGVIVISGTGSIVYGMNTEGRETYAGGWGHLLGDEGSGYDIALCALRAVARAADERGSPTQLSDLMLSALGLTQPRNLIPWIHGVSKDQVAQLAVDVFGVASAGDSIAQQILDNAADELTVAVHVVIDRLRFSQPFDVVLSGGILTHQPTFADLLRNRIETIVPTACICLPKHEPAYGAVILAKARFFK